MSIYSPLAKCPSGALRKCDSGALALCPDKPWRSSQYRRCTDGFAIYLPLVESLPYSGRVGYSIPEQVCYQYVGPSQESPNVLPTALLWVGQYPDYRDCQAEGCVAPPPTMRCLYWPCDSPIPDPEPTPYASYYTAEYQWYNGYGCTGEPAARQLVVGLYTLTNGTCHDLDIGGVPYSWKYANARGPFSSEESARSYLETTWFVMYTNADPPPVIRYGTDCYTYVGNTLEGGGHPWDDVEGFSGCAECEPTPTPTPTPTAPPCSNCDNWASLFVSCADFVTPEGCSGFPSGGYDPDWVSWVNAVHEVPLTDPENCVYELEHHPDAYTYHYISVSYNQELDIWLITFANYWYYGGETYFTTLQFDKQGPGGGSLMCAPEGAYDWHLCECGFWGCTLCCDHAEGSVVVSTS